jgi:hypothetical protein
MVEFSVRRGYAFKLASARYSSRSAQIILIDAQQVIEPLRLVTYFPNIQGILSIWTQLITILNLVSSAAATSCH